MSLIEEHPKVREIREQQRKLDDAQKASQARVSALMEPYWQKVAEYEQAAQTAILNGRKPPVRPEEPDLGADRDSVWTFMQERQRLAEQVRQTVREIAPELLEQVEAAKTKLMGKAEKTVATLDDVVRERRDARERRGSRVACDGPDRRQRERHRRSSDPHGPRTTPAGAAAPDRGDHLGGG